MNAQPTGTMFMAHLPAPQMQKHRCKNDPKA